MQETPLLAPLQQFCWNEKIKLVFKVFIATLLYGIRQRCWSFNSFIEINNDYDIINKAINTKDSNWDFP
nr:hypothetical protein [Entomoplasma sp. MP1]